MYTKLNVTLLCDVMEAFREICYNNYRLDPFYSYTAPGLSSKAMLRKTNVCFDLITDYDMYVYIESAVRGGFCVSNLRFAAANNPAFENPVDYYPNKSTSHIIYLNLNNLYGRTKLEKLPIGNFKWVENVEDIDILNVLKDSPIGLG